MIKHFHTAAEAANYYLAQIQQERYKLSVQGSSFGVEDYDLIYDDGQFETTTIYHEGIQSRPQVISAEEALQMLYVLMYQDGDKGYRLNSNAFVMRRV